MKTLCLLESISRVDGGIFEAELSLQRTLVQEQGVDVSVVGLSDVYSSIDINRWVPIIPKVAETFGPRGIGYSKNIEALLPRDVDLAYGAVLWKYPSKALLDWQKKYKKPVIVAPHGSLDSWALNHSKIKKKIAAYLYKNEQLHSATCFRALCQSEADSIRAYGLKQRIEVIPNGVELPEEHSQGSEFRLNGEGRKRLLFLGRIHPKKGLIDALLAWKDLKSRVSNVTFEQWQLVIAGWDQGGHEAELVGLSRELGLRVFRFQCSVLSGADRAGVDTASPKRSIFPVEAANADVIFCGPAFGHSKETLLRSADAFILPSFSEGLPMSVLEAWAYSLPVVMTPECNLPEGFAARAAIQIVYDDKRVSTPHDSPKGFQEGLQSLFDMSETDRINMGRRGRLLLQEKFTWRKVAAQMKALYEEIV